MLRFPATQGTILVQCPVCSHRFTFDPDLEIDSKFTSYEKEIPSFSFQPSIQNYKDLFIDLMYAPIDYFKSKQKQDKFKFSLIPILMFAILFMYIWKWSLAEPNKNHTNIEKEPNWEGESPLELPPPNFEEPPLDSMEEEYPPTPDKPSFEI